MTFLPTDGARVADIFFFSSSSSSESGIYRGERKAEDLQRKKFRNFL
jgi:hypothetical protein